VGRKTLLETLKAGLLCNDARLVSEVDGWRIEGDPTEGALLVSSHKAGLHRDPVEQSHPRLDAIPFEFGLSIHGHPASQPIRGRSSYLSQRFCGEPPESLQCHLRCDMNRVPLNADVIHREVIELAERGLRVLAFARRERPLDKRSVDMATWPRG